MSDAPKDDDATAHAIDALATAEAVRRQPLWTYFLTPVAILIGSFVIAGAIWYVNGDDSTPAPAASAAVSSATSGLDASEGQPSAVASVVPAADLLATFTSYAKSLNLDQAKFTQCLGNTANADLLNTHIQRGNQFGVDGTPTFIINNKEIVGAQPDAIFDEVIKDELAPNPPTTLAEYSVSVQALANTSPPRFQILDSKPAVSDAYIEGGGLGAKVMIAEFSDFQCPFCKRWTDTYLAKVRAQFPNVALAFINFPIVQIHPNAANAAVAAMCAGEQGKFWDMHDILFARQQEWEDLKVN